MANVVIFWLGIMIGIPALVLACRLSKYCIYALFFMMIFSLLSPDSSITFDSHETYKAGTRGFEVHIADLIAIVFFVTILLRKDYRICWAPPMLILMLIYFAMGWVSWAMVGRETMPIYDPQYFVEYEYAVPFFELKLYPLFELSKIARGIFIFWVMFNLLQDKELYKYFVAVLSVTVIYIFMGLFIGRYAFGEYRSQLGTWNSNDLDTYVGIAAIVIFPQAFVAKTILGNLWYWFMLLLGLVAIVFTVSRSSLAGLILASMIVTIWMLIHYPTAKNFFFTALSSLLLCLAILKAASTLHERFNKEAIESSAEERKTVYQSAYLMGMEHTFGVGLGNFSAWQVNEYAQRSGSDPYGMAHHIWYLTFAELGFPGLIAFILIWLRFYQISCSALRTFKNFSHWIYGYPLILGIICASIVMQFQNRFHFSFRQTSVFLLMHICMAFSARAYADRRAVMAKYIEENEDENLIPAYAPVQH